jgi:hypothetical protein
MANSRGRAALALEELPDKAQSLICVFASAPSCPAHVLLAGISKTWAAESARHFRLDGGSIELQLWCCSDLNLQERQREVERLEGLAGWLWQQGHLLNKLSITVVEPDEEFAEDYVLEAGQVVPSILAALAAAGKRPGGLRLQQLLVPAFPSTHIFTICRALSGCHHLRELHLGYSHSTQVTPTPWDTLDLLPAALQQLTQLTSLKLDGGYFDYYEVDFVDICLDDIFKRLPSSLVVFELGDIRGGRRDFNAHPDTLQHLGALQKLALPYSITIHGSGDAPNPLAQLTAVTSLSCEGAMLPPGEALLALPNLEELLAGQAEVHHLEGVCSRTALRSLGLSLSPSQYLPQTAALAQLTQLTALKMVCVDRVGDVLAAGADPEQEEEEDEEEDAVLAQDILDHWAITITFFKDLRSLSAEPVVLEQVDLTALTSLTHLEVNLHSCADWYPQPRLEALLRRLVRVHGMRHLNTVLLKGMFSFDKEGCAAALAAAFGNDTSFTYPSS